MLEIPQNATKTKKAGKHSLCIQCCICINDISCFYVK